MPMRRRQFAGLALAAPFALTGSRSSFSQDGDAEAYFAKAKIDWKQAAGQSLTIGLNKHSFTESLLPLIPQFKRLTGINIEYLVLPEDQYNTKLAADLSNQRGEFSVIMCGAIRNWQYVSAD